MATVRHEEFTQQQPCSRAGQARPSAMKQPSMAWGGMQTRGGGRHIGMLAWRCGLVGQEGLGPGGFSARQARVQGLGFIGFRVQCQGLVSGGISARQALDYPAQLRLSSATLTR